MNMSAFIHITQPVVASQWILLTNANKTNISDTKSVLGKRNPKRIHWTQNKYRPMQDILGYINQSLLTYGTFAGAGVQKLPGGCGHVRDWALHDSSNGQRGGGDTVSNLGTWRSSFYVDQTQQPVLYPCFFFFCIFDTEDIYDDFICETSITTKFKTSSIVMSLISTEVQLNG